MTNDAEESSPTKVKVLASSAGFTEGPVWTPDGSVVFTSINRGRLYQAAPLTNSTVHEYVETGGGPNGLTMDGRGQYWIAQNGGAVLESKSTIPAPPSIQRFSRGRGLEVIASADLRAPNDCAFGPDGRLWFTDPGGSSLAGELPPGKVFALDVLTGQLDLVLDGLAHPNGLAFGEDFLIIGETRKRRLLRYPLRAGKLGDADVFAELPSGEPDGMALDTNGYLYVAATHDDSVLVFDTEGGFVQRIDLGPSFPTNLCFAGPKLGTLVVTAAKGGRLLALPAPAPGRPLLMGPEG